ncbi:hypothetical protein BBJ28_00027243 [Nothophytophthora sp. Chile5]|nr:hypothetical protein BBJ28_00027243 [Nothophytophthora sp. Chile5]
MEGSISLNIAFEAINKRPQYIAIMAPGGASKGSGDQTMKTLQQQLLGDKGYSQLEKMFMFLASMRSIVTSDAKETDDLLLSRSNIALQNKLQLLSILINIIAYRLMEVHPRKVRKFMRKLLEASSGSASGTDEVDAIRFDDLLMEDVEPADEILSTGLPLLLALWQVLHYHIEQEVPHKLLRSRLVKEQWELLDHIVRSYELGTISSDSESGDEASEDSTVVAPPLEERFLAFVAVQATRWQATLLLLIDSLALASELVTPERLDFLACIGEYMEWEGSVAHDLARYQRDASERVPNAYLFWLSQRGIAHSEGEAHESEFREVANALAAAKWEQLQQEARRDSWTAAAFSLPAVERVIGLIRQVYGDHSGRSSRKESF